MYLAYSKDMYIKIIDMRSTYMTLRFDTYYNDFIHI